MEKLRSWYDSREYQAVIALRTEHTQGGLVFANEFELPG